MRGIALSLLLLAGGANAALPPFEFGKILSMADPVEPHPEIEGRYTADFTKCLANPDLSNYDQQQCDQAEMARQDARLNAVWKDTMGRIAPAGKPALRTAERAWIKGREKHCQKASREAEGTLSAVLYGQCIIDETIRRTLWLEKLR